MPFIIHAENCDDGTDEWLEENKDKYDLEIYIDHNDKPKGIGGGMHFCVDKVKTELVNIIHADMWCAPNQDLELLKLYDGLDKNTRLIASSFRIQPKIFPRRIVTDHDTLPNDFNIDCVLVGILISIPGFKW